MQQWNPGQLLQTSGSYWMGCTLHAGVKLDIFSTIAQEQKTARKISSLIHTDLDGTSRLLDALVAMGLLTKHNGDSYANTPESAMYLQKSSPKYIGYMIMHHHHLVESWSKLDQAVTTGKPVRDSASHSDGIVRESFLMGMFNNAMIVAPMVTEAIHIANKHHLLDLGGGPGTYAIHFCQKNPSLKATIYDLTTTKPFAEKVISQFGMDQRIDFIGGDYVHDNIPGSYDVAWLSHILHGEGPEDCQNIISKTVSVLNPGGVILIHDFILKNTKDAPVFPSLFSLNMLVGTENGRAYAEKEIGDMLAKAGVENIRRITINTPNDSGIIIGERP
ncbi:MAG: SAM-dependent methyltransferase [Candidatus Magnetoglobus multicellularis str. Araruama]|uniref:SAM-dependent methyltransferase n=1 Tax=Candidatus Magnetoglobus multicellularis str. Araruama TaxID=890399 RepID=A0A1V1P436_9BACT|nr:MAG: SAM-dependent methyltransferase [Candidatus Magnetoglobus multicellularis str. Araruama]